MYFTLQFRFGSLSVEPFENTPPTVTLAYRVLKAVVHEKV